jgi:hypothetical protein
MTIAISTTRNNRVTTTVPLRISRPAEPLDWISFTDSDPDHYKRTCQPQVPRNEQEDDLIDTNGSFAGDTSSGSTTIANCSISSPTRTTTGAVENRLSTHESVSSQGLAASRTKFIWTSKARKKRLHDSAQIVCTRKDWADGVSTDSSESGSLLQFPSSQQSAGADRADTRALDKHPRSPHSERKPLPTAVPVSAGPDHANGCSSDGEDSTHTATMVIAHRNHQPVPMTRTAQHNKRLETPQTAERVTRTSSGAIRRRKYLENVGFRAPPQRGSGRKRNRADTDTTSTPLPNGATNRAAKRHRAAALPVRDDESGSSSACLEHYVDSALPAAPLDLSGLLDHSGLIDNAATGDLFPFDLSSCGG